MTLDDEMLRRVAQNALKQALEAVAEQLRALAQDPDMKQVNGQDALNSAANAILTNNARTWG